MRVRHDGDDETETAWRTALATTTRGLFATATSQLSPPECRRERAFAVAAITFEGLLRKADVTGARAAPDEEPGEIGEANVA